ncbi:plasmid pRiA4b ORF-3 family protein [Ensifer sp. PDNC004]|uniref:plasmid pRiA4b ORF-3 family protein n=1 Tax=Ensifer sp. PDNC004 TaxID=2811423 RepID=UPI001FEDC6CE|nr:plasmid pRiA4b ORF-3 family protein [Ensifer sp. PDNC004]
MTVDRIARLHIQLDDIEPLIWRRVEVPLTMSLKGLHDVIQAVCFLSVMARPRHAQHPEFVRWYGGRFEPEDLSVDIIQDRVAKIARRRTLGKLDLRRAKTSSTDQI